MLQAVGSPQLEVSGVQVLSLSRRVTQAHPFGELADKRLMAAPASRRGLSAARDISFLQIMLMLPGSALNSGDPRSQKSDTLHSFSLIFPIPVKLCLSLFIYLFLSCLCTWLEILNSIPIIIYL